MKSGIAVMVIGVLVLLSGIGVVVLAPWKYIRQAQATTAPPDDIFPELEELQATIRWLLYTFLALIANLFLSGIALIFAGYGLYRVKGEKNDSQ